MIVIVKESAKHKVTDQIVRTADFLAIEVPKQEKGEGLRWLILKSIYQHNDTVINDDTLADLITKML